MGTLIKIYLYNSPQNKRKAKLDVTFFSAELDERMNLVKSLSVENAEWEPYRIGLRKLDKGSYVYSLYCKKNCSEEGWHDYFMSLLFLVKKELKTKFWWKRSFRKKLDERIN